MVDCVICSPRASAFLHCTNSLCFLPQRDPTHLLSCRGTYPVTTLYHRGMVLSSGIRLIPGLPYRSRRVHSDAPGLVPNRMQQSEMGCRGTRQRIWNGTNGRAGEAIRWIRCSLSCLWGDSDSPRSQPHGCGGDAIPGCAIPRSRRRRGSVFSFDKNGLSIYARKLTESPPGNTVVCPATPQHRITHLAHHSPEWRATSFQTDSWHHRPSSTPHPLSIGQSE